MTTVNLQSVNSNGEYLRTTRLTLDYVEKNRSVIFDTRGDTNESLVCRNLDMDSVKTLHSALSKIIQEDSKYPERPQARPATIVTYKDRTYFIDGDFEVPETSERYGSLLTTRAYLILDKDGKPIKFQADFTA